MSAANQFFSLVIERPKGDSEVAADKDRQMASIKGSLKSGKSWSLTYNIIWVSRVFLFVYLMPVMFLKMYIKITT